MDVCRNNPNTNFNGVHLMRTNVLKKIGKEYLPHEANIVEMSFNNPEDVKALEELPKIWKGGEFTDIIASSSTSPNRRIYAITTQTGDFERIDSTKILGAADFSLHGKNANLRFLQAKPSIISQPEREITGIGKYLMQGICKYFKEQGMETMDLFSTWRVKPFYKKIFPTIEDKPSTCDSNTNLILKL